MPWTGHLSSTGQPSNRATWSIRSRSTNYANRWDYTYTIGVGSRPSEIRRITVFFEDDRLVRITGDMRPQPESERVEVKKEVVVTVPDWEPGKKSWWRRTVDTITFGAFDE